jgi:hypothetical protein
MEKRTYLHKLKINLEALLLEGVCGLQRKLCNCFAVFYNFFWAVVFMEKL